MSPSAMDLDAPASEQQNSLPPPTLYPAKDLHFDKYLEPQPDGYQKAKSRGSDQAAIVIDNGNFVPRIIARSIYSTTANIFRRRFIGHSSWLVF